MSLRTQRERAKLTQKELAEKVGVSQSLIQLIESGQRTGSVKTNLKLAQALNADIEDILHAQDNTESNKREATV